MFPPPRWLAAVTLLLLCALSPGQGYGQVWYPIDNATFKVEVAVTGVGADDHKISGTNVLVTTSARAQHNSTLVANPVVQVRLFKSKLTVGSETVFDDTHEVNWSGAEEEHEPPHRGPRVFDPPYFDNVKNPRDCRFTSTHFDHGSVVTITLTCTFKYKRQNGEIDEVTPPAAIVKPKSHNQVALWRTNVNGLGGALTTQQTGWIQASYQEAYDAFTAAKYSIVPGEISSKSAIVAALVNCTAVFGLSHGSLAGVTDSTGLGSGHSITWSEFESGLGNRYSPPGIPPVSHIFLYACQTTPGGQSPDLFWLWREPLAAGEPIVNAGSFGFDSPYPFCAEEAAHVEKLFQVFASGNTAYFAVLYSNEHCPIPRLTGSRESQYANIFLVGGDSYSTFSHVYLPPAIRNTLGYPGLFPYWYWVPVAIP